MPHFRTYIYDLLSLHQRLKPPDIMQLRIIIQSLYCHFTNSPGRKIDNPFKTRCCGSYQTVRDKFTVAELTFEILTRARKEGAECVTTSCPLCMFNLADRQKEVKERHPEFESMPVLYFTQLMALALGLDENDCGFDQNVVDPRPLLKEKSLIN